MSPLTLIIRSLRYNARTLVPAALALAVATAVIVGALVIGRSSRESLRDMALGRLGRTTDAVVGQGLFADDLGQRLGGGASALILRGAVEGERTGEVAPSVSLIGVDADFGRIFPGQPRGAQTAINEPLARALGASVGDDIVVTLARHQSAPLDTLFAQRSRGEALATMRLHVDAILPAGSCGDFALDAATTPRYNLFVNRSTLAQAAGCVGKANTALLTHAPTDFASLATLADRGLSLRVDRGSGALILQSDRMLLHEAEVNGILGIARTAGWHPRRVSVYLADTVKGRRKAAYDVVAAIEGFEPSPAHVRINQWAADDIDSFADSPIRLRTKWPLPDGSYRSTQIIRRVDSVLPMSGLATDADLTPRFDGITDAMRISDWQAPFPVKLSRVTKRDELYWQLYRAAPRVFVCMADARAYWRQANPAGNDDWVTGILLSPPPTVPISEVAGTLAAGLSPRASGVEDRPVRALALRSASASNDFASLFLGLGFFVIVSAAASFGLVIRLSIERRAGELGLLKAFGFDEWRIAALLLFEVCIVSAVGALLGAFLGTCYARGVLALLAGPWNGALSGAVLRLHLAASDVAEGALVGWGIGLVAAAGTLRGLLTRSPITLLRDLSARGWSPVRPRSLWSGLLLVVLPLGALLMAMSGNGNHEESFLCAGFMLLAWFWLGCDELLDIGRSMRTERLTIWFVALRNCAMRRRHTLLVMGLIACAAFLLVAIGANSRRTGADVVHRRDSGSGGYSLVATSSLPMPIDFSKAAGRARLGFSPEDEAAFKGTSVVSLLMSDGEEAGCRNLSLPLSPRLLGVGPALIGRDAFAPQTDNNLGWTTLASVSAAGAIPTFADEDTAQWVLGLEMGGLYHHPATIRPLRIEGLIPHSIFSGELLIPNAAFRTIFPAEHAPRYFLIETPPGREEVVASVLRRVLGITGLDVRRSQDLLESVDQVQNSYLLAFRALGALGLLLGVAALGAVIVRGARERRGELAVMQAIGFGRRDLAHLLVIESLIPLLAGLVVGTVSALAAVLPNIGSSNGRADLTAVIVQLLVIFACGLCVSVWAGATAVSGAVAADLRGE